MQVGTALWSVTVVAVGLARVSADDSKAIVLPVAATANEIAHAYAERPADAAKKYGDRPLRIAGEVDKFEGNNVYLHHDWSPVWAVVLQTPAACELRPGDPVRATGSIAAVVGKTIQIKTGKPEAPEAIEGTWIRMSPQQTVNRCEEDWRVENGKVRFLANRAVMSPKELKRWGTASYRLDPLARPGRIDLKMEGGEEAHGIYTLADDVLVVCLAKPGGERPSGFRDDDEKGTELLVFERHRPKGRRPAR